MVFNLTLKKYIQKDMIIKERRCDHQLNLNPQNHNTRTDCWGVNLNHKSLFCLKITKTENFMNTKTNRIHVLHYYPSDPFLSHYLFQYPYSLFTGKKFNMLMQLLSTFSHTKFYKYETPITHTCPAILGLLADGSSKLHQTKIDQIKCTNIKTCNSLYTRVYKGGTVIAETRRDCWE